MKRRRGLVMKAAIAVALCVACGKELYVQLQQSVHNRQLIAALMRNDTRTALALVNAGANPNTPYDPPSASSLLQTLRRRLQRSSAPVYDSPTALLIACGDNDHARHGDNVDSEQTLQQVTLVQAMLAHGADVDAQDWIGKSALPAAAAADHWHVADLLLKQGMSANARDGQGKTPLHWAAFNRSENMVRLLLAHGADPNAQDRLGNAALHYVVVYGNTAHIVQMLLKHGADPNLGDRLGATPLMVAQRMKHPDLVRLLRQKR